MPFNYSKAQATADRLIKKFGGKAKLRRNSGDRDCVAAVVDYTPEEKKNSLINPIDRVALISALNLEIPPNSEADKLVILDNTVSPAVEVEVLRIVQPPGKLAPAGVVVYWELHVRG